MFLSKVVLAGLVALAWWALRPLPSHDLSPPAPVAGKPANTPVQLAALDARAFSTPIWVAPPAPPAVSPPPPPLPPIKLQLIALVRQPDDAGGAYHAIIYDPDLDRTVTLRRGDQVGGRKVERITGAAVEFREGATIRSLSLAESRPAAPPAVAGGAP